MHFFKGVNKVQSFLIKNENSAINYSPSCRSKPVRPLFIFRTQIKIFVMNSKSSLTLHRQKMYRNSLDCLIRIHRKEGVRGINRGMVTTVIRETPGFGIYFLAYDTLTRALGCDADADYIIPKLLLAGGMSGMASWISTYPVDVIKSRLQADGVGGANRYDGIVDCVRQSWRREGWRTFTRGLTSTLLRAFPTPGFGIYFLAYDTLTRALGCDADADYIIPKLLLAGGMSGMASWISTYPVDVIKSRLQADGVGGANRYDGIVDCVRQSWRREGWRTFTRGLTSTLLRAFPVNATTFATVTLFLMYMDVTIHSTPDSIHYFDFTF
uniref:Solute carrier family 25 member 29 n=1 Tax=Sinocyclocheilus grahami TaxID=75366 RepID=A0A672M767_SINGR